MAAGVAVSILITFVSVASGSEIAWGDVDALGALTMRSLDTPVTIARGVDNFFIADPMEAHDWTHVKMLNKSLAAHIGLAKRSDAKLTKIKDALTPLYTVMPKDEAGLLANGTVRYALHRYFRSKYGWSVKGLEPAGGSWVKSMAVTPDVKDMTKYMMPSYLQDFIMRENGVRALDLTGLAVLAASIEHLVRLDLIAHLYAVYATLEYSTADRKRGADLDDILDSFMTVYAFGVNMDVTSPKDLVKAKRHLEKNHMGWRKIQAFVRQVKQEVLPSMSVDSEGLDFSQVMKVAAAIEERYPKWQGRDCQRAKSELTAMPQMQHGRVPVSEFKESHADSYRSLFTETVQDLNMFGVIDPVKDRDPQGEIIVPNYINSQAMCLSTASFYTSCCPNECEDLLSRIETHIGFSQAQPQRLADAMKNSSLPPHHHISKDKLFEDLKLVAVEHHGSVPLHSRGFASVMHAAFPLECSAPSVMKTTNPKTPDEWMEEPHFDIQDTDDMMREISNVLFRYTTMSISADHEISEEEFQDGNDIIKLVDRPMETSASRRSWFVTFTNYIMLVGSMGGVAATVVRSGFAASGASREKTPTSFYASDFA